MFRCAQHDSPRDNISAEAPLRKLLSRSPRRPATEDFASWPASPYHSSVLELEVYATGVRALNKILEPGPIAGLHYRVNRNHEPGRSFSRPKRPFLACSPG